MGDIHLKLRPTPGNPLPLKARLGKTLKYALRACGLQCVDMRMDPDPPAKPSPPPPAGEAACK